MIWGWDVTKLSATQQRLYDAFKDKPDTDIAISAMYDATYRGEERTNSLVFTDRYMQQRLGPIVQRLNKKLDGQRIEPGQLKRTYRLNTKV